jgi:UbiD family decarboxylase
VPLEVPAHAEVVTEGWVEPGERHDDGPGPSQALYYLPGVTQQPVFEASAITTRDAPILRQHNTLMYSDHQPLLSLPHEALLFERLRAMSIDVHEVFYVPWGGTLACVVQMTPRSEGEVRNVLLSVLGERWPSAKLAIAIDDDVDIGRPEDLVWSIATRVDPERDLLVVPAAKGHPIDPTARHGAGGPRNVITGKWGIDATKPPLTREDDLARFERTVPPRAGEARLEDFL